jgi:glutaredoxin 3
MSRVTVYSTGSCPVCVKAKSMLSKWEIPFTEQRIDSTEESLREFKALAPGTKTVPQILIDGKLIGGFSELTELHMDGDLDKLMNPKK